MAEDASPGSGATIAFGPFRLFPTQQLVLDGDHQLALGSRAYDILMALVARAGEVVSKAELIASTWPNTFVEESNLRVHVAGLRRALRDGEDGNRYVATIPGRGYRFVAPIISSQGAPAAAPAPSTPFGNLPPPLTRLIGRSQLVDTLSVQLLQRRFLTLVGPGGIGKTTVAMAIAHAAAAAFRDGAVFVDLAPVGDPRLVPSTLAAALGQAIQADDPLPGLIAVLKDKHVLLVLDSCEHVIEIAAEVAERVIASALGVHVLATSREPLRAAGERTHRLAPLETPAASEGLSAAEALRFPGVELFAERAAASLDGFELTDADVPIVIDICRQLDGIALAIELAARRVDAFGVRELAAHLDDRFRLLTSGRRTVLPRHQTLRAALDWSYDLLPESEAAVLRRLAVFAGDFALDAAIAVAGDLPAPRIVDHVASLVAKSLIVADLRGDTARYRLLDSTRLYAQEKLRGGELRTAARRHAEYYRMAFEPAEAESEVRPQAEWLAAYGRHLDNVRAALDWAFSPEGDPQIGVALTIAAVPLWVQLSLLGECRERVERALVSLGGVAAITARPRMQLSAALAWALMYGVGRAREAGPAWAATLELAEQLDDSDYRRRALWGLCINQFNNGEFRTALEFARRFAALVENSTDAVDLIMGDRILATALHYLGDQNAARHHIDQVIARLATLAWEPQIVRLRFDMRVSTHYFQARILWLQGFPDQALRVVEHNIEEGRAINHALTFCSVLGQGACPIAFLAGDLDAAVRYGAMLLDHTERHPVRLWHLWARCFNGVVMARRGDLAGGLQALRSGLEQAGEARFLPRFLLLLGELAACLGQAGEAGEGLATVDEMLARCETRDEGWYVAELLRIKGELILEAGGPDAAAKAEEQFLSSLDWARRQGALSWELRSTESLSRLRRDLGRTQEARGLLSGVYDRFTEGYETGDLRAARLTLATLP